MLRVGSWGGPGVRSCAAGSKSSMITVRFGPGASLDALPFAELEDLLQTWTQRLGDLAPLVGFNHLARR